jgi:hypothetical protein
MWRIYMDNEIDRWTLITLGVTMRGRHVGFHTQNPRNPARQRPDTTRTRGSQEPVIAHLVFNLTSNVDRKWGCYT